MRNHTVVSFFRRCASKLYTRPRQLACSACLAGNRCSVKGSVIFGAAIAAAMLLSGAAATAGTLGNRAGAVAHDALIYAAVRGHLIDVDVDSATALHVDVDHGIVTLSGEARTAAERARYVAATQAVSGVMRVRDEIAINPQLRGPSETTRDDALAVSVYAALVAQSGVNAFHVSARVRDGVVTLEGNVPNGSIERTIVTTAGGVQGVRHVVNRLTITH